MLYQCSSLNSLESISCSKASDIHHKNTLDVSASQILGVLYDNGFDKKLPA